MIVGHDMLWGIPITFEDITENYEDIDYFYGEEDPFSSEEE